MGTRPPDNPRPLNRLSRENSPYLRQHATNPVDWWPWCPEALAKARELDRPIFLSIGYSACHWCHVMEEESFSDPAIAALMNELFINIKVDREERPDLDAIYMSATVAMTGSGGWPMSVWLTPDQRPFYAGTYFPPDDRYFHHGRPGFATLCKAIGEAWQKRRDSLERAARALLEDLAAQAAAASDAEHEPLPADLLDRCVRSFASRFDRTHGGTLGAPKFPPSMHLFMVLRAWHRTGRREDLEMVTITLDRMAQSGTYDQLGGGFHRYATDERWLIPHFEKMLYDNALLLRAYAESHAATGSVLHRRIASEIITYVAREMTDPSGLFYATQDADSEGEEGRFFAWTPEQLRDVLGPEDGAFAARAYGVTREGNFEHGTSVLSLAGDIDDEPRLARIREVLFRERERRPKPFRDEKVLVAWNGLMIAGLCAAARHLGPGETPALAMARQAADALLVRAFHAEGRLAAVIDAAGPRLNGYLDDHAFLAWGLIELAALTGHWPYLKAAIRLHELLERHFADPAGGYFFTSDDHERLVLRTKDPIDNAIPAGNSVAAMNLLLLHELTGEARWLEAARRTIGSVSGMLASHGAHFPQLMLAVDWLQGPTETLVIAGEGPEAEALHLEALRHFAPRRLVVRAPDPTHPDAPRIVRDRPGPAAYLCRQFTCQMPARRVEQLRAQLTTNTPNRKDREST